MSVIGNSPGVASQRVVSPFTATSGQTIFTPISGYTLGYCDVFLNGIKLANGDDYTASNGTTVVLAVGAALGDFVEVVAYFPRGLSDGYLKAEADARFPRVDTASQGLNSTQQGNARTNINAVNKAGDTMSGNLKVQVFGNATASVQYGNGLEAKMGAYAAETNIELPSPSALFKIRSRAGAFDTIGLTATYSGTERDGLLLDNLGRVTMPYQPRFCVGSSGDGTTYTNDAILKMSNNEYDPVTCYDPATGRFTAPVAGFYHFDYTVRLDNNVTPYGSYIRIRPHKNGSHMEWVIGDAINPVVLINGNYYMHMQQSFSANLAQGDYIDLRIGWGSGGPSSIALSNSGWSGYLIA